MDMISDIETTDIKASVTASHVIRSLLNAVFSGDEDDMQSSQDKKLLEDVLLYGTMAKVAKRNGSNPQTVSIQLDGALSRFNKKISTLKKILKNEAKTVGACDMFKDPDWDGDTYCPVCGNWPCTCRKRRFEEEGFIGVREDILPPEPDPCPICGHLPCTCEGPRTNLIDIKLSNGRRLSLETTWEQKIFFGDEFISLDEYVKRLFGRIPEFFSDADDLREKWANPETREQLLRTLDEAGFAEEKLLLLKDMLKMQNCDLLDVLEYIAYDSTPIERAKRVELVKKQYVDKLNKEQREFDNLILQYYVNNGFKELSSENLGAFIKIKFNSTSDAKERLNMSVADIRAHYFELQRRLYSA